MVTGLETFAKYFEGYSGDYVVIGGVACELALDSMKLHFRGTEDFDIVIVTDHLNVADGFGKQLKRFIQDGGYYASHRQSNDKPTFFRFLNPKNGDFPSKLELATKKPFEGWEWDFAPLVAEDFDSSLSAILFSPGFYPFILDNAVVSNGISIMCLEGLIPLKCHAFLKLSRQDNLPRKTLADIEKHRANIEKHRGDIFRLADALPTGKTFVLPDEVATSTAEALNLIADRPASENEAEVLTMLRRFYGLL